MKRKICIGVLIVFLFSISVLMTSANSSVNNNLKAGEQSAIRPEIELVNNRINKDSLTKIDKEENNENGYEQYTDDNNNTYIFKKNKDECVGFLKSDVSDNIVTRSAVEDVKTQEECKNIAIDFLMNVIDFENYTLVNENYTQDTEIYTFNYSRFIRGYQSSDFAFVTVDKNGNIKGYAAPNVGIFNNVAVPEISSNLLDSKINSELTKAYGSNLESYDILNRILIYEEGRLSMVVSLKIEANDYSLAEEIVVSID